MPKNIDKGNGDPGSGRDNNLIFEADGVAGRYIGGRGDDTYFVDHADDVIIEKNNGGQDTIIASVDWTLDDNVENLTFEGDQSFIGIGNAENNEITGSLKGDTLDGGLGDDVLFGGAGDDALYGGDGTDTLYGGDGIDTAYFSGSSSDYTIEVSGDDVIVMSLGSGTFDYVSGVEFLAFDDTTVSTSSLIPAATPTLVATPDSGSTTEETGFVLDVLANDAGAGLQIVSAQDGQLGKVTINADGTLTYTPYLDATGDDIFSYTVMDQTGSLATTDVTVEIQPVNDAPIAVDDSFAIDLSADYSGTLNTLTNDADPDGDTLSVIAAGATEDTMVSDDGSGAPLVFQTAAGGEVTMNADGSFTYSAGDPSLLEDAFTYAVSDGSDALSTATVALSITASTPDAPAPVPEPTPNYVDGLIYGDPYRLNAGEAFGTGTTISYSFLNSAPDYYADDSGFATSFMAFNAAQEEAARSILSEIEGFTNLTFTETSQDQATITFGLANLAGFSGLAYRPEGSEVGTTASDVWIDSLYAVLGGSFDSGSAQYMTLMHEIGHAVGLDHATLPDGEENQQYTVMDAAGHPTYSGATSSFQLYDVAALQYLYGSNGSDPSGDDTYTFEDLADQTHVIWDAGGTDTLDLSAATLALDIDLNEGAFSDVTAFGSNNVAIAFGTTIENAIGGDFDDVIQGNEADNWIDGGGGNDSLAGGDGADTYGFGSGWGQDTIEDYSIGEDRIDFSGTGLRLEDLFITTADGNTYLSDGENTLTLAGVDGVEQELDETFLLF